MVVLREYQQDLLEKVRSAYRSKIQRVLMVLPTGAGKTVCFSAISEGAASRGSRVLILAHRIELIDQICESLEQFSLKADVVAPGYDRCDSHVCVASVQSMVGRLGSEPAPDMIICDEAHHVATSTKHASGANSWGRIFRHWPEARHLGVTATPLRLDGRGLGEFFDEIIVGPQVPELMAMGHLAPCRIFAPPTVTMEGVGSVAGDYNQKETEQRVNQRAITGDAVAHYRKHADGKRALIFAISIDHAKNIAEQFREGGYKSVSLSGDTAKPIRRAVVHAFHSGELQVLVSCDLFSEGFDCPGAEVGIMLRPTKSLGLYRQQVGRILRPAPQKIATLLDHVGNTLTNGLPDEPIEWALSMDGKKRKTSVGVKVCPGCYAAIPQSAKTCPECGFVFTATGGREIDHIEGSLEEITEETRALRRRRPWDHCRTYEELVAFAKAHHYKPGWVYHVWRARTLKSTQ